MAEHVVVPKTYYCVFAGLIALTLLTVGLSFLDLGAWHTAIGVAIAVAKMLLVALFFMHLWHSSKLTWVIAAAGLFWLAILIGLTMNDYATRHLSRF